ncbi:MAG TPA: TetR/AcrR family transcriptional regulator [Dongiaceae bacterium]|nr:TetR/AcrR family transcriptional regulator [Dongiaceae bacterium]
MTSETVVKTITSKAERTRAAILASAENHFSRLGFAATRMEDIADELGMTRAALFYYFRDKQTLYDAMIADSFGALASRLGEVLVDESATISQRLKLAVGAWVDAVVSRPNLARLVMRFIADGIDQPTQRIFVENEQVPVKFFGLFAEGRANGELKPLHDDPFHAASAIIGTTVFYVSALTALVPNNQFEPLDPEQVAIHRREALHSARRLLGISESENAEA